MRKQVQHYCVVCKGEIVIRKQVTKLCRDCAYDFYIMNANEIVSIRRALAGKSMKNIDFTGGRCTECSACLHLPTSRVQRKCRLHRDNSLCVCDEKQKFESSDGMTCLHCGRALWGTKKDNLRKIIF